jgi:hypothetical protein
MKRVSLFSVFILIGVLLACFSTKAKAMYGYEQDNPPIVLQESESTVDPNSPRSPTLVPITCYFNSISEVLNFNFIFPMGDVTITLTEASAGVVSTNDYSTSSCFVAVPVPGPGTFSISVLLDSGTEYTGQFVY